MIIGTFYKGDDDRYVAGKQHAVYGEALGIIVRTCNRYAAFAKSLLGDTAHTDWGAVERFDHRTLQGCHDLLAAAWRFTQDTRQQALPFPSAKTPEPHEAVWLDWLRRELSAWIDCPHLVRAVQIVLTNQNQPVGYVAERELCAGIMERFDDIPWDPSWRLAHERVVVASPE